MSKTSDSSPSNDRPAGNTNAAATTNIRTAPASSSNSSGLERTASDRGVNPVVDATIDLGEDATTDLTIDLASNVADHGAIQPSARPKDNETDWISADWRSDVESDPDQPTLASASPDNLGPLINPENTVAATWALFLGIGLLMVGNGLQGSLIGIRSGIEGFSTLEAGAVMTFYFIGILAGSRLSTRTLATVGHIRVFAALASMASGAALVHALSPMPLSWAAMRFVTGFCMAGLYIVAESWINDLATNKTRGKLMAIYMAVTMGGFSIGQLLLNVADPSGFELFVLTSLLVSMSLVPVSLSASSSPPMSVPSPMSLRSLASIVPTGIATSLLVGMAHGSLLGMGAVYATAAGLRPSQVALFMGAPMFGGFILQLPIGSLSDRVPRRGVMFAVAIGATVVAAGLLLAPAGGLVAYLLMFLLGGCSFPLYSLAISYTNDWLEPKQILGASSALVTVNSVGAIIGPLFAAGLMIFFDNRLYFVALIATHAAIACYLIIRIVFVDAIAVDDQRDFIPFPARASAGAVNLLVKRIPPKIARVPRPGVPRPRAPKPGAKKAAAKHTGQPDQS